MKRAERRSVTKITRAANVVEVGPQRSRAFIEGQLHKDTKFLRRVEIRIGSICTSAVSEANSSSLHAYTPERTLFNAAKNKSSNRTPLYPAPFAIGLGELRYSAQEMRDRPLVRYVLEKIDSRLRSDSVADYSMMAVEHVAPQNPIGDGKAISIFSTIGNLILVYEDLNQNWKTRFVAKKKMMVDAAVPMDKAFPRHLPGATRK